MTPGTQRGKQILIVEADASFRDGLAAYLQREGLSVQSVADDREALKLLDHQVPDLILLASAFVGPLDEYRRHHLALTGTPLVVLGPAEAGTPAGDVSLSRSVQPEQLLAVIRQYLSRPQPAILVVEDDLSIQRMFQVALETAGFVVWQAATGPAALELFQQHDQAITLVLLDVQLVGPLDGPQTLLALRQQRSDLPGCFMSGHTGSYTAEQLLALGVAHIFPKPFPNLAEVVYLLWRMVPPPARVG